MMYSRWHRLSSSQPTLQTHVWNVIAHTIRALHRCRKGLIAIYISKFIIQRSHLRVFASCRSSKLLLVRLSAQQRCWIALDVKRLGTERAWLLLAVEVV